MTAVTVTGVSKQFKGGTTALQGIDLEIEQGEFVSLIGPSGCGKSTLLRVIGDLIDSPEVVLLRGHVLVENDELVAAPGVGQYVKRARFGEELKPAKAVAR
jgi:ABC-type nitrate/sulfonate/bicarbonate transport system ATPase subunit